MRMSRRQKPKTLRRKRQILELVKSFLGRYQRAPTMREIVNHTDVTSTSVASYYIDLLVEEGKLERDPVLARAIRVPGYVFVKETEATP